MPKLNLSLKNVKQITLFANVNNNNNTKIDSVFFIFQKTRSENVKITKNGALQHKKEHI